jgi:hypothetical protein
MIASIIAFFAKRTFTAWIVPAISFAFKFYREIIIVALLCLWQLKITAYNGIVQEFAAFKQEQQAIATAQIIANETEWQARQKIIDDAKNSQTKAVNDIRAYYAKNPKIRYQYINRNGISSLSNNACTSATPKTGGSAARADQASSGIAETSSAEVVIDMQVVAEEVTQCINLIEYVKRQDEVTQD